MRLLPLSLSALALALACASGPRTRPLPAGVTFEGKWDSNFHEMLLHQTGNRVSGTVGYRDGSLEGTAQGDVLRFKWYQRENQQRGRGYLQMSPDGRMLEGRWGYLESDSDGGRWWAARASSE